DSISKVAPSSARVRPQRLLRPWASITADMQSARYRATLRYQLSARTLRPMPSDMKPRSHEVTDGFERAPARAMLRAIGMTDDDWDKPQVGVASSWNEVTPCNLPLDRLAKRAKVGIRAAGGFPPEFVKNAVSEGNPIGQKGMQ